MTGKIAAAALLIAAFGYALWLYVFRKPPPAARGRTGWRWGFFAAVAVFAAWMGARHYREAMVTCYVIARPGVPGEIPAWARRLPLSAAARAAWWSLDDGRGEELQSALAKDVAAGGLNPDAARLLLLAFHETARHYDRTHGPIPKPSCYDMPREGVVRMETREHLFTRLALLVETRGRLDAETFGRIVGEITESLSALDALNTLDQPDGKAYGKIRETLDAIQAKTLPPDAAALEAAFALADLAQTAPEGKIKPKP